MKTLALLFVCCTGLLAQVAGIRVVGKPYSATEVTHSVQTLGNGSHIDRTVTSLIWMDEQGRTRTETTTEPRRIVIQDLVAMVVYSLDAEHKTARKNEIRVGPAMQKIAGDVSPVEDARAATRHVTNQSQTVEDLGSQIINGVTALGVRVTGIIPVGAIGNDQELKSVSERWYSNDIHAIVKTVSTDPRFGVQTYELTNIVRAAPDPVLFQVPAGFTITSAVQQ